MLKRLAPLAALLVALAAIVPTPPAHAADRAYTLCDATIGKLCSSLVAYYKFEEATNSYRTSETGSAPFLEPADINVTKTTVQYSEGAAGLDLNNASYLYLPRVSSLGAEFTIALWIKIDGTPGTLFPTQALLRTMTADSVRGSYLSFVASGGNITPRFTVRQSVTDTGTYVAAGASYAVGSPGTWHHIAFGAYPTPTTTEPYQITIWMSLDGAARTAATAAYPAMVFVGDFQLSALGNCAHTYVDGMAVFAGTLSPEEVSWVKNNPGYPFTSHP